MNEKYPDIEVARKILKKLGVNPVERIDDSDQDFEYTSCRVDEIEKYVYLYKQTDTSVSEKRILGCYLLQTLNDTIEETGQNHPNENEILELLFSDIRIHEEEIDYWCLNDEDKEENLWPITSILRDKRAT